MPLIHENRSFVEFAALAVVGLALIAAMVGFFANLKGLQRYFRMKRM